jgi:2-haloalkanoic acid dehalogenase type II
MGLRGLAVKAIFLDFYGTVVHEDQESLVQICHRIKEESMTEASVGEIGHYWMKEFNELIQLSHSDDFLKQRELSANSLRNTLAQYKSSANEAELLELMFHPWKQPAIFTDAVEFFEKNTLPVYILSNVDHSDITEAINLLRLKVEGVITSEDVKAYKPHRFMFEFALTQSGLSPEEVLHVGDSLISDVYGANQVGIKSVWLNRNGKPIPAQSKPTYVIENLNEVLSLTALVNS